MCYVFSCVSCAGEAEHAAIGHNAVLSLVPAEHQHILRKAMQVRHTHTHTHTHSARQY